MKRIISTLILTLCLYPVLAQQFNLYNSRTLYDVFENPSQSAYQIDTSRRIAFNFFIPAFNANATFSGSAEPSLRALIYDGVFNGEGITVGDNQLSTVTLNTNNYIAMLRLLKTVKKSREFGASWQIRNDAQIKVTNETLAIFDDYRLFTGETFFNLFNNKGHHQAYHQFGLTYRENVTKRLAVGVKGSLLSGIMNNDLKITQSSLQIDETNDLIDVNVAGVLRSSYDFSSFNSDAIFPNFKNAGVSLSAGASYKFKDGWFLMGNVKDLGFIRWSSDSYLYKFDAVNIIIENASNSTADDRLADSLDMRLSRAKEKSSYFSVLNGRFDVLLNKDFGNYQPNLILSKNFYYDGGEVVLSNNYKYRNFVFSLSGGYNTNKIATVGGQFMVKSPNVEFYLGSDHLFRTVSTINTASTGSPPYSAGPIAASFYIGFGLKFGKVLEHPANANNIPGFERSSEGGFLKRIFRKKSKSAS